ncbi:MAG: type 4a pilus biogenesis protein PilO [Fimbriimonadaceae bacterium]|nr:type 4a pilus biogenesis protein PilO [Fimbriimonadaceae bacterium]
MKSSKILILLSLAVFAAGGTACYYQWQDLSSNQEKTAQLRSQVSKQADVQKQLDEITLKVDQSQEKLNHLEQGVPVRAYVPTLMAEIESLGKLNGIRVTGVRPMAAKFANPVKKPTAGEEPVVEARKTYEEQLVEVKGMGHFLKVLSFLEQLESFPKIVAVQSVTMIPKNDLNSKSDPSALEIVIEIKAFVFPSSVPSRTRLTESEVNHEGA